jgi:alkanesulfonate monooxygenase SsuD/methylene tetrahydromethanopterin reductase-like flavin-dependent oxidoreductase (luciferase family)
VALGRRILNVVPSPQHGPAILQAGTSPKDRMFAARYADAIFAIQPNLVAAKAYYDDIKRGTVEAGRRPEACKILFGIQPILGATEAEARVGQPLSPVSVAGAARRADRRGYKKKKMKAGPEVVPKP